MSELFGHEKGSFTGAAAQKIGRFEMAEGGTIFLDEIADITPQTQVALLRVLQERQFERVGGTETIDLDVRVICATNKNLEEMVEEGTFRLDLYYRLKGMVIELPALRDRRGDIPLLVERFAEKFGKQRYAFERAAMRELVRYSWPGNIRELQNFIKSMLLFVEGSTVTLEHVQEFEDFFSGGRYQGDVEQLLDAWQERDSAMLARVSSDDDGEVSDETSADVTIIQGDPEDALVEQIVAQGLSLTRLKKRLEIECIKRALIETDGNVTQAASILQMKRPRLSQIINADEELVELKNRLTGS
jgi:transcriptional regulator with GAF, ATPase, and Fis domain